MAQSTFAVGNPLSSDFSKECEMSSALRKFLLVVSSMLLISASSFAGVITFDNLSGNEGMIPEGYAGLNWANFGYINVDAGQARMSDTEGMISAPNVAFSIPGSPNCDRAAALKSWITAHNGAVEPGQFQRIRPCALR